MITSNNDIKSKDPFDILIFEKGLRIKNIIIDQSLDLIVLILNNGKLIQSKISYFQKLTGASQEQLNKWTLISGGIGVQWEALNEDLSIKGFIKDNALKQALNKLQTSEIIDD
jgi:hypothetical protein